MSQDTASPPAPRGSARRAIALAKRARVLERRERAWNAAQHHVANQGAPSEAAVRERMDLAPTAKDRWGEGGAVFMGDYDAHRRNYLDRLSEDQAARDVRRQAASDKAQAKAVRLAQQATEAHARLLPTYREYCEVVLGAGREPSTFYTFVDRQAAQGDKGARTYRRWARSPDRADPQGLIAQARDIKQEVADRLENGFVWEGGAFGSGYEREPFVYAALKSEERPNIYRLLVQKLARKDLRAGMHKEDCLPAASKLLALDLPYVTSTREMRGILRGDFDRVYDGGAAEFRSLLMASGVPLPNIVVGWVDALGRLHRPHAYWIIQDSVCWTAHGHRRFKLLLESVHAQITAVCLPVGADPLALCNPNWHKNPLSPLWDDFCFVEEPYTLGQLSDALSLLIPGAEAAAMVGRATPSLENLLASPVAIEHSDPEVQGQSGKAFVVLRKLALETVAHYVDGQGMDGSGGGLEAFAEMLHAAAADINPTASARSLERQAVSVAEFVWKEHERKQAAKKRAEMTAEERKGARRKFHDAKARADIHRQVVRRTHTERRTNTDQRLAEAARTILGRGEIPTQAAVAAAIGVTERTAAAHWPAVLLSTDPLRRIITLAHEEADRTGKPLDQTVPGRVVDGFLAEAGYMSEVYMAPGYDRLRARQIVSDYWPLARSAVKACSSAEWDDRVAAANRRSARLRRTLPPAAASILAVTGADIIVSADVPPSMDDIAVPPTADVEPVGGVSGTESPSTAEAAPAAPAPVTDDRPTRAMWPHIKDGLDPDEIADAFGASLVEVIAWLSPPPVPPPRPHPRPRTPWPIQVAADG